MDAMRLFVAIPLPHSVLERLAEVQHRLQGKVPHQSVRWVKSESIHLTLKFLGDTPAGKVPTINNALTVVARSGPKCTLTVEGLGCFPSPRRPRVLWVGVTEGSGRLQVLQQAVEEAMTSLGYRPERHRFTPHLTLGRVRRGASHQDEEQICEAIGGTTVDQLGEFAADRFELIRSELKPSGAEYTTVETFLLRGRSRVMGPLIGVIGGSSATAEESSLAERVGRRLAEAGATLICGGHGGVMEAACRGAAEAGGLTIGILPGTDRTEANAYVTIPIVTGIGHARNIIIAYTAEAVIAVGGSYGTLSEIAYALIFDTPVVGLGTWSMERQGHTRVPILYATEPDEAVDEAMALACQPSRRSGDEVGG